MTVFFDYSHTQPNQPLRLNQIICDLDLIVEVGVEPTKLAQQILSLPPLTTRKLNWMLAYYAAL